MDLVFDLTIMTLLVVTIIYAWRLNAKLNVIRNHKAQLNANIKEFYKATDQATKAVKDLQKQGQTVCRAIDGKISKARLTADEIDFLIGRANRKIIEVEEKDKVIGSDNLDTGYEDLLDEVLNTPKFDDRKAPKVASKTAPKLDSKFNSVNEAQLAKALRDKQYRDALVG